VKLSTNDRYEIIRALELAIAHEEAKLSHLNNEEDEMMFGTSTKELKKDEIKKRIFKLQQLMNLFNDNSHIICVLPSELFRFPVMLTHNND